MTGHPRVLGSRRHETNPGAAGILPGSVLEGIRAAIAGRTETLPRTRVNRDDLSGALAVLLLVVVATLPVTLPFVLLSDAGLALNVSKVVALVLLFLSGAGLGHYRDHRSRRLKHAPPEPFTTLEARRRARRSRAEDRQL